MPYRWQLPHQAGSHQWPSIAPSLSEQLVYKVVQAVMGECASLCSRCAPQFCCLSLDQFECVSELEQQSYSISSYKSSATRITGMQAGERRSITQEFVWLILKERNQGYWRSCLSFSSRVQKNVCVCVCVRVSQSTTAIWYGDGYR